MVHIREYHSGDAPEIEQCIVELQAFERRIEPNRADPQSIAAPYLAHLLDQCRELRGAIFVAAVEGAIAGFVCVLAQVDSGSPIEVDRAYAYVSDLVVMPLYRGRGIWGALLQRAETYAAWQGAAIIKVDVLAANAGARAVYRAAGFQESEIHLQKRLWKPVA